MLPPLPCFVRSGVPCLLFAFPCGLPLFGREGADSVRREFCSRIAPKVKHFLSIFRPYKSSTYMPPPLGERGETPENGPKRSRGKHPKKRQFPSAAKWKISSTTRRGCCRTSATLSATSTSAAARKRRVNTRSFGITTTTHGPTRSPALRQAQSARSTRHRALRTNRERHQRRNSGCELLLGRRGGVD